MRVAIVCNRANVYITKFMFTAEIPKWQSFNDVQKGPAGANPTRPYSHTGLEGSTRFNPSTRIKKIHLFPIADFFLSFFVVASEKKIKEGVFLKEFAWLLQG